MPLVSFMMQKENNSMQAGQDMIEAFNAFAIDLFKNQCNSMVENMVMSPFIAQVPLLLAMFGAAEGSEIQAEMQKVLKVSNQSDVNNVAKECKDTLKQIKDTKRIRMVSKLYLSNQLKQTSSFSKISKLFGLPATKADFDDPWKAAKKINNLVVQKTSRKLTYLLAKDDIKEKSSLVMVSGIHFKLPWEEKFDNEQTFSNFFFVKGNNAVYADYMRLNRKLKYASIQELQAQVLEIPFKSGNLVMDFLLPFDPDGLGSFVNALDVTYIMDVINNLEPTEVTAEIPVFEIDNNLNLTIPLRKMGMERIFSDNAELCNMIHAGKKVRLDNVVQKAFISIDETGKKQPKSLPSFSPWPASQLTQNFRCSYPFMFIIRCTKTNSIYMIGRVSYEREGVKYVPKRTASEEDKPYSAADYVCSFSKQFEAHRLAKKPLPRPKPTVFTRIKNNLYK